LVKPLRIAPPAWRSRDFVVAMLMLGAMRQKKPPGLLALRGCWQQPLVPEARPKHRRAQPAATCQAWSASFGRVGFDIIGCNF